MSNKFDLTVYSWRVLAEKLARLAEEFARPFTLSHESMHVSYVSVVGKGEICVAGDLCSGGFV